MIVPLKIFILNLEGKPQNQNAGPDQKPGIPQLENSNSVIAQQNAASIKIDPSIFVSLKKGSITNTYKLGNVLGEGYIYFFLVKKKIK